MNCKHGSPATALRQLFAACMQCNCNLPDPQQLTTAAAHPHHCTCSRRYIRQQYPFWDRHGGRDHFFWLANDRGACDGTEPAWAHIHPAIKLVHFGAFNTTAGLQPGKKVAGLDGWVPGSGAQLHRYLYVSVAGRLLNVA
jgi:hypothetical protein